MGLQRQSSASDDSRPRPPACRSCQPADDSQPAPVVLATSDDRPELAAALARITQAMDDLALAIDATTFQPGLVGQAKQALIIYLTWRRWLCISDAIATREKHHRLAEPANGAAAAKNKSALRRFSYRISFGHTQVNQTSFFLLYESEQVPEAAAHVGSFFTAALPLVCVVNDIGVFASKSALVILVPAEHELPTNAGMSASTRFGSAARPAAALT